jgi:hypothetical protein
MTPVRDARLRRLARLYLDPLSTWCLAAVVVHALTTVAAGDVVALKLVLPIGIGIAAFLLRWADEPHEAGPSPHAAAATPRPAAPAGPSPHAAATPRPAAPVRPTSGSLWSRGA